MNFNNGNDNNNNKNNSNYVRAVRGGKYSLLSFESIYLAYLDCRKRKRGTVNALRFEYDVLDGLFSLVLDIQKGTYCPSRSVCFITRMPKLREIFAADFRDRIVHHLLVRELEKQWEPRFIYDSYACRKNKGIHAAVKRLQNFMQKASCSGKKAAYYIQLDIRSFFMSINKYILFAIFNRTNLSEEIQDILRRIIFHDCTENYYFRGDKRMLENIPPHKSLFKVNKDKGLPIGNLTSQFFANVYLDVLDQFVKHTLRCRFYIRYVDDFLLISSSVDELQEWKTRIEIFLKERLFLELKPGSEIRRLSEGADFLGYIVRPGYLLVRRRVVNNLKYRLAMFREKMVSVVQVQAGSSYSESDGEIKYQTITLDPETVIELRQMLASYLGHFKHAQTLRLIHSLLEKHDWLNRIFTIEKGLIHEKCSPKKEFRSLRSQVRYFRCQLDGFLLFTRIGSFVEMYDDHAETMQRLCGGSLRKGLRGMKAGLGFPASIRNGYIQKALAAGYPLAMLEEGMQGKWIRHRYIRKMMIKNIETHYDPVSQSE